jgi:hypothetical protein
MKYLLIGILIFTGCATIEYEGFRYTRIGNQELIDVTINITKNPDGSMSLESHLGRQFSEREISEIIKPIISTMLEAYGLQIIR